MHNSSNAGTATAGTNVEPRPYQARIVRKTLDMFIVMGQYRDAKSELEPAVRSVMIESPTGSGKSCMGLLIARELQLSTYTGTTDYAGIFRTGYIKNLGSGAHRAEVMDLALASYFWDLDMGYDGDEDGDGLPDNILNL